ncbi:MAG: glycine cleavage system protein H [Candidatus Dactylopiibacterium carminicum]|uniref:Glycine cleavage system H protein n=1 Tax=Candidatus Dactylopiibacterium carminicum TaxID=857335 RepID=A0A272EUZ3_9RHOO|nr:glycine cleavage system protein GcvH [Candidatus Dactylopiibacterium carminicum]KAF7599803.1 glycine cleavage system protein H [Candidatus Dactylopiibacterium carminicum]PAS93914.1 MAG: glycine cleavage system protein H [Candidatus Dactylopiibacterium carminicum]PAS97230.1 MAG: glycine cleavage system protein H [Candidatus Dactylopiibacterium carminicum]PAS99805.1 MAG: glycine cleavage system protein H [Candidatus Dactylopiibacterium carminicum]
MSIPANLRYTESHEWIRKEPDNTLTIGITDHAQEALGDIVFLDLPTAGRSVTAGEEVAVVESVKAASDIYAPVAGEIIEANSAAIDSPESVNSDPYGAWLFKLKPANLDDIDALLDAAGYAKVIDEA